MPDAVDIERERRSASYHNANLNAPPERDGEAAEILRYLAEIDDLPIDRSDPVMGQLVSKLTSTANLSAEQVKSNEWVFEYLLLLYLSKHPPKYGQHGAERAIAHDDPDADREPLGAERRMELESFIQMGKLGLSRSEDFKAVEETTRNVRESVVHQEDDGKSGGGIWGRIKS